MPGIRDHGEAITDLTQFDGAIIHIHPNRIISFGIEPDDLALGKRGVTGPERAPSHPRIVDRGDSAGNSSPGVSDYVRDGRAQTTTATLGTTFGAGLVTPERE